MKKCWAWDDGTALYHYGIEGMKWGVRRWQNADGSFNDEGKIRYGRVSMSEHRKQKNNYKLSKKEMNKAWLIYKQKHNGHYPTNGTPDELRDLYKDQLSRMQLFKEIQADELTKNYVMVAKLGNELRTYQDNAYKKYEDQAYQICKKDWKDNKDEYIVYGYTSLKDYWDNWGYHILEDLVWEDKKYNRLLDDYYASVERYGKEKELLDKIINKYYGDGSIDRLNANRPEKYIRLLLEDMAK